MASSHKITLLVVLLACTAAHAFGQAVQFVPQGCNGLKVAATARFVGNNIVGKAVLSNPNTYNIPITQVQVMLANNIPVAPMYVTAFCGGATHVPSSPIPYEQGTLTCYFTKALPSSGPANTASAWTSVRATATIKVSNAACASPVAPIQQLLLGRK